MPLTASCPCFGGSADYEKLPLRRRDPPSNASRADSLIPEDLIRSPGGTVYRLYPQRWLQLFLYCLLAVGNGLGFIAFSPIATSVLRIYKIENVRFLGSNLVDWCSFMFYVVYFLSAPFIGPMLQRLGLRGSMVYTAVAIGVGGVLRLSVFPQSFWFLFASSAVLSFSTPPLLSASTQLASVWFGEKERGTATAIAVARCVWGCGVCVVCGVCVLGTGVVV